MAERRGKSPFIPLVKTVTVDLSDEFEFILDEEEKGNEEEFHEEPYEMQSATKFTTTSRMIINSLMNRVDRAISTEEALKSKRTNMVSLYNMANQFVNKILKESLAVVETKHLQKEENEFPPIDYALTVETQTENSPLFEFADEFINGILQDAVRRVDNFNSIGISRFRYYATPDKFTVQDGIDIVAKIVSQWSFNPNWYYKTLYNGRMISDTSHTYYYIVSKGKKSKVAM